MKNKGEGRSEEEVRPRDGGGRSVYMGTRKKWSSGGPKLLYTKRLNKKGAMSAGGQQFTRKGRIVEELGKKSIDKK